MTLFDEEDATLLKKWIVKRLEDISDADADVLADYVLALLRHEQSENEVKQMCEDQLLDFLRDHTSQFVNDLFGAIRSKSYLSINSTLGGGSLRLSTPPPNNPPYSPPPAKSESPSSSRRTRSPEHPRQNFKKRSHGYVDRDAPGGDQEYSYGGRGRGTKSQRRGGNGRGDTRFDSNGRWSRGGGEFASGDRNRNMSPSTQQPLPAALSLITPGSAVPGMPMAGMPWGTDPMSQFLAAQAAVAAAAVGGWPLLPFAMPPPIPQLSPEASLALPKQTPISNETKRSALKIGQRCNDYDERGYCMQGDMCPYEHSGDRIVVPGENEDEEYDPKTSLLSPQLLSPSRSGSLDQGLTQRGNGRGRGRGGGRGGGRSDQSSLGPNHDKRNTTLVVENIPADKLDNNSILAFFSSFGDIDSVDLKANKSLALVKFSNFEGAKAAYSSPTPIFDNRFVKVFWHKTNNTNLNDNIDSSRKYSGANHENTSSEAMDIDMDEFNKKQEEAQKVHDEKTAKKRAIEEAAKELEKRKEDLLQKQQEQKRLLLEKLARKHGATSTSTTATSQSNGIAAVPSKEAAEAQKTAALRAQLEALEAEAASLGIDHSKPDQPLSDYDYDPYAYRGRGRGRGTYRGRGAYMGRGHSIPYSPYVAHRGGRGASFVRGPSTMKLDNRTRKIMIGGIDGDKDEGLRQHLLHLGEFESIEPIPDKPDSQIVTFKDRRTAETFFYNGSNIPNVGKVELSWYNSAASAPIIPNAHTSPPSKATSTVATTTPSGQDVSMQDQYNGDDNGMQDGGGMNEYDVAEDDEGRWE